MANTEKLAEFNWILLESAPKWIDIDKTSRILIEKGFFDSQKHQQLFHSFDYLKQYMNDERIDDFKKQSKPVVERWVEFFNAMKSLAVDYTPLDKLVSYVLTIPGNLLTFCNLCLSKLILF